MWEDQEEDDDEEEDSVGGQLLSDILATSKYGEPRAGGQPGGQTPLLHPPRPVWRGQKGPAGARGAVPADRAPP